MRLPYPIPTSAAVSAAMRANRKSDTRPELALRSALHRRGVRFRLRRRIVAGAVRVMPDLVLPKAQVAVFVDGCWWHRCPEHSNAPRANQAYWVPKLARNVERDRRVDIALLADGWTVVRTWEHEDAEVAAGAIQDLVRLRLVARRPLT